jgi:demethylmenaquinone methyltransferase / 2-methoxy-6-polyprenyl-1,4-benzoquinol methylase
MSTSPQNTDPVAENAQTGGSGEDMVSFGFQEVPRTEKAGKVRAVFDSVAKNYDVMNDLMSLGVHRIWKDIMADRVNPQPGERILDLASGTGDIARRMAKRARAAGKRRGAAAEALIVASDINHAMLLEGKLQRNKDEGDRPLERLCADAQKLPFADKTFDAATIAFGIRNVTDIPAALAEIRRVLKPGGRFACLEFSHPNAALQPVYDTYSFQILPLMGGIVAKDSDSYRYLAESIRRFPKQKDFAAMMQKAGFARVDYMDLTGGVTALHWGYAV